MDIDLTDGDFTGSCICYIPGNHVEFFDSWCGFKKPENNEDFTAYETDYGYVSGTEEDGFQTESPDILIMYLSWLFKQDIEQIIRVEYQNPFWAIHDAEHAKYDEQSCSVYVNQDIEQERLQDTFKLMHEHNIDISYELCQEVSEAFNGRFGTKYCFYEHCLDHSFIEIDFDDE